MKMDCEGITKTTIQYGLDCVITVSCKYSWITEKGVPRSLDQPVTVTEKEQNTTSLTEILAPSHCENNPKSPPTLRHLARIFFFRQCCELFASFFSSHNVYEYCCKKNPNHIHKGEKYSSCCVWEAS